ncbi:MAG: hypothetical protein QW587_09330, partial [Candidatus Bathyarchaeia archaeon]
RAIQYVKERIGVEWSEGFDDHYPCRREGCSFTHYRDGLKPSSSTGSRNTLNSSSFSRRRWLKVTEPRPISRDREVTG